MNSRGEALLGALDHALRVLRWLVALALAATAAAGCIFIVAQHETAFVLRWGRLDGEAQTLTPGLHFAWPAPAREVVRVPVQRVQTLTSYAFWPAPPDSRADSADMPRRLLGRADRYGGYTMTADGNLLHSAWSVRYRLRDPARFVFGFAAAELFLREELDGAVLQASAASGVEEILRAPRDFIARVEQLLRARCEALQLGVVIERAELLQLAPPPPVRADFEEVLRAEQEYGAVLHEAQAAQTRIINEARAAAARIQATAAAEKVRTVDILKAEADYFLRLLPSYQRAPGMWRQVLLQERVRPALAKAEMLYLVDKPRDEKRELRLVIGPGAVRLASEEKRGETHAGE